jgi:hypothetical protein
MSDHAHACAQAEQHQVSARPKCLQSRHVRHVAQVSRCSARSRTKQRWMPLFFRGITLMLLNLFFPYRGEHELEQHPFRGATA